MTGNNDCLGLSIHTERMTSLLFLLLLASHSVERAHEIDCTFDEVPVDSRPIVGEAVLAKRLKDNASEEMLLKATDICAKKYKWSVQQALHADGYTIMRLGADRIASKLGKPHWSSIAAEGVSHRPAAQVKRLAGTGTDVGNEEFTVILKHMIAADPSLPRYIASSDKDAISLFALMVKLRALGELERIAFSEND